jgi:hypothetical protein
MIDSTTRRYEVQIGRFIRGQLRYEKQLEIDLKIFFFRKRIYLDPFKATSKKKITKTLTKKPNKTKWSNKAPKIQRLIRSFKLEKLWINIDTDDYYYNAILYPIFFFIKGKNYRFQINFAGENEFILILKNRPIRLLSAWII